MARKIERQSETTPSNTLDEYLWNQKLGVSSIPPIDPNQGQASPTSLPPDPSAAPIINFDSSIAPSDQFGSGISGEYQRINTQTPNTTPASVPATSKAAAVSTLYGDVNPTPTIGDSGNNGSQANRNNSSENLPNGPDASPATSPAAVGEEEGGAGLAADLGEAASLAAFASKHWVGSVLDPIHIASNEVPEDEWEPISRMFSCSHCGEQINDSKEKIWTFSDKSPLYDQYGGGVYHKECLNELNDLHSKEASMNWKSRYANNEHRQMPWPANNRSDIVEHIIKEHEPIIRYLMGDDQSRNQVINNLRDTTSVPSQYGTAWEHFDQLHYFHHMRPGVMMSQPADHEHGNDGLDGRQASKGKKDHYKYIKKRGDKFVIIQKGTGKVLSTHDSKEKAIAAFKAMEMHLHG